MPQAGPVVAGACEASDMLTTSPFDELCESRPANRLAGNHQSPSKGEPKLGMTELGMQGSAGVGPTRVGCRRAATACVGAAEVVAP